MATVANPISTPRSTNFVVGFYPGYHPRLGATYFPVIFSRKLDISSLPRQLLLNIFRYACASPEGDTVGLRATPWSISQVCRAWRYLALRDPNLWVAVILDRSKTHCATIQNTGGYAMRIESMLRRSGRGPLFIDFKEGSPQEACKILLMLSGCSQRWMVVRLSLRIATAFQGLQRIYGQLPCLRSLHIVLIGSANEMANYHLSLMAFSIAPALRNVTMLKSCIDVELPWRQIVEYCGPSDGSLRNDLIQRPYLKICRIRSPPGTSQDFQPEVWSPNQVFRHEQLVTLELEHLQDISFIQLPALKHLALTRDNGNIYSSLNEIIPKLGCSLETFCGPTNDFTLEEDFRTFLQLCPRLKALQLIFPKVAWSDTDNVIKALVHPTNHSDGHPYLAPNLTQLTLAFMPNQASPTTDFKVEPLFDMLMSRSSRFSKPHGVQSLKRVSISIPDFLIPRLPQRYVGQLKETGTEVTYKTWTSRMAMDLDQVAA